MTVGANVEMGKAVLILTPIPFKNLWLCALDRVAQVSLGIVFYVESYTLSIFLFRGLSQLIRGLFFKMVRTWLFEQN